MWGKKSSAAPRKRTDPFGSRGSVPGSVAPSRLADRRRKSRRIFVYLIGIAIVLFAGFSIWGMWQPEFRIHTIQIFGGDDSLRPIVQQAISGTYFGIVPRDSMFVLPEHAIRERLLATDAKVAAVSIARVGFDTLSIKLVLRSPLARWCGISPTPGVEEYCYVFDSSGNIFGAAGSSTPVALPLKLYAPLAKDVQEPLRASIPVIASSPATLDFSSELKTLGAAVSSIVVRGDEVDDLLVSGTRITYVLGQEQDAFAALMSAKSNFNLSDGSVDYIDLRFEGKVYLKKKEEGIQ